MKPGVWDAVLKNVRIVISTYQILFDAAVSHAFVKIESLGLVVIDEGKRYTSPTVFFGFVSLIADLS